MRRLITLISAGRNRIVMIRRELPRTRDAGWAGRRYRIEVRMILLAGSPGPVARAAAVVRIRESQQGWQIQPAIPPYKGKGFLHRRRAPSRPRGARRREALRGDADARRWEKREWQAHCTRYLESADAWLLSLSCFHFDRDRPDKPEQFAADGSYDLRLILSAYDQFLIARAQPPLRFPGDRFDLFLQPLLPLGQVTANPGFVLVGPRRLPQ